MYVPNSTLETIVKDAVDNVTVIEYYNSDVVPPFDPSTAVARFAAVEGVEFLGFAYTKLVTNIGRVSRTSKDKKNSASVTLDNLERAAADLELDADFGFEGKIKVIRLLSRSLSTDISHSLVLFAGRCEKPDGGTKKALTVQGSQVFGGLTAEIPRRKFTPEDANGRVPSDPLFEGFKILPQYGTTTYYRRKSFLGIFSWKKRKRLQWSSFSDVDADKDLPFGFGRVQVLGTHLGYADVGTKIRTTTAFLEGEIKQFLRVYSVDYRFSLTGTTHYRLGRLGNAGAGLPTHQIPVPVSDWVANGYYSRTAWVGGEWNGTNVDQTDPAPDVAALMLATIVPVLNDGTFSLTEWSDNAAALVRFLFLSKDYENLAIGWLNDASFIEAYQYNHEFLFDTSFSDLIFAPTGFVAANLESHNLLLSTGSVTPEYFKWLKGDVEADEAFYQTVRTEEYSSAIPIDPTDFPDYPTPGGGSTINLSMFLRRRYVCNGVASEKQKLWDWLSEVILPNSRMFLTQGFDGKINLKHKKPVDFALGTAGFAIGDNQIALDDVSRWIDNLNGFLLIQPHSVVSEIRQVTGVNYSTAQNAVTLTASANITVTAFSGCDGVETPATALIEIDSVLTGSGTPNVVTLDGEEIAVVASSGDNKQTVAGFFYGSINAHPRLRRKFTALWEAGDEEVLITAKFGALTLDADLEYTHPAPGTSPAVAPVLTETASGNLPLGTYRVAHAFENENGRTLIGPVQTITTSAADKKITVSAVTPPAGFNVVWYASPEKNSFKLRYHSTNNGASFVIDAADLPKLHDGLPNDFNRTGTEVMRVAQVFTDGSHGDRISAQVAANCCKVLKSSYRWLLGRREESINIVEIDFRDATQDFRAVTFRLREPSHIAKITKEKPLKIDGSSIDSFHQAYRVANGTLAEQRDADFFYQLDSDREALFLEESDVVCVIDSGAGVVNLPVIIEDIDYQDLIRALPKVQFVTRKYSTTLYDDSVVDREIPVFQTLDETAFALVGDNITSEDIEITDSDKGLILTSPDGTRWRVQADDTGTLTITEII